jgi:hypothetical protein
MTRFRFYMGTTLVVGLGALSASAWARAALPAPLDIYLHDTLWVLPSPAALLFACAAASAVNAVIVSRLKNSSRAAFALGAGHLLATGFVAVLVVIAARAVQLRPHAVASPWQQGRVEEGSAALRRTSR